MHGNSFNQSWGIDDGMQQLRGGGEVVKQPMGAHTEARRQSIFEAALRVFARKGVQAATMAEIAEEAGISAGLIYRYFPNKDALSLACLHEGSDKAASEWTRWAEESSDPLQVFYDIARTSFEEIRAEGASDVTRLMLENMLSATRSDHADLREAVRARNELIVEGLRGAIQRAQDAGQLPAQLDAYHLAQALLAFYTGARAARMVDPENDTDAQLQAVWTLFESASGRLHPPES